MRPRTDRAIALAILIGAFLIRLIFVLQTRRLPFYYHPVLDSGFFDQWAGFKKSASWFDFTPAFREPLYAYFLAAVYTVLRQSLTIARLVQGVLGSITALMIYWSARMLYGRLAGIVAGVIFALSSSAIFFTSEINETTLLVFLLVSSGYLLLRAERSRPYINSCFSGLLLGACFLTQFASVAALPAWIVHLLLAKDARLKRASILVIAGFMILPLCYQVLLVKAKEHPFVPLRVSWQAFLGSGQAGEAAIAPRYDVPVRADQETYRAIVAPDRMDGQRDALRLAKVETGRDLSFGPASRHWRARAIRDFTSSPRRYLGNYLTKLGIFWGPSQPPANVDLRFVSRYSFFLKNALFSFAIIAPLGLIGLMRRGRTLVGFAVFVILYSLAASFCLVSDMEKMVVVPFLAIFGATVVSEVILGVKKARPAKSVTYILIVGIVGALLYLLPHRGVDQARELVILGDIYREEAIFDKAQDAYKEAIGLSPASPAAYISLSKIYSTAWKPDEALGVLSEAKGAASVDPRLNVEKASLLLTMGKPDEAGSLLRSFENRYPYEPRLHEIIGISLLTKGDIRGAIGELQKELDYVGGSFVTYAALGKAHLGLGEFGLAAGSLETASKLNPSDTGVAMQLADAYNKMGQYLQACDVLSRVLAIDPGNMALRFKFANSLYRAERYPDALKQFRDLSNFDPRNADFLVNMGTVYAAMDSISLAVQTWEKALSLDPANELARENLKAVGK
jgi:tetratricopeptide (TPR) repeat protein/4-amino-4-deoxy-L-arabinose transferase-like glycosyltransferase